MTLSWKEFLNLAAVVQNLFVLITSFYQKKITITALNRRLTEAAEKYLDFYKDSKYTEFTKSIRIKWIHR